MTKFYKSSCSKSIFEYIKKTKRGWLVRWNAEEHTEGEGDDAYVVVTYNETMTLTKPTYASVVSLLIRERYSVDDELALHRQKDTKVDEFAEYNAFCEAAKEEARKVVGNQ